MAAKCHFQLFCNAILERGAVILKSYFRILFLQRPPQFTTWQHGRPLYEDQTARSNKSTVQSSLWFPPSLLLDGDEREKNYCSPGILESLRHVPHCQTAVFQQVK